MLRFHLCQWARHVEGGVYLLPLSLPNKPSHALNRMVYPIAAGWTGRIFQSPDQIISWWSGNLSHHNRVSSLPLDHLLFAHFCYSWGQLQSQAQICTHCGTYAFRETQPQFWGNKYQRIIYEWNKWIRAVKSLSRLRLYLQIAEHAKGE